MFFALVPTKRYKIPINIIGGLVEKKTMGFYI